MFIRVQYFILILILAACGTKKSTDVKSDSTTETKQSKKIERDNERVILFFGNSITAGYQLDLEEAFPALIQKKIDSLGLNYKTINAGLSGETTAGGKNRIDWVLRTIPDIFFLELGANDGLRGLPLDETSKNLQAIIDAVKKENPNVKIVIAGMMVPPNLGVDYSKDFQQVFSVIADENNATLIPFVLDGVAGDPELNLSDGIHPTPEGHQIVAENVWKYLKPLLD